MWVVRRPTRHFGPGVVLLSALWTEGGTTSINVDCGFVEYRVLSIDPLPIDYIFMIDYLYLIFNISNYRFLCHVYICLLNKVYVSHYFTWCQEKNGVLADITCGTIKSSRTV